MDSIGYANAVGGVPAYSGRALRQLNGVNLAGATAARPLGARSGVRPGTSTATVTATSTTWSCGPFAGDADVMVAAESGAYPFSFDAPTSGTMTAADGSNPRVDIVYVKVTDPENGSTVPKAERLYLAGAAAATPAAPAAPAGGFTIANINVPKAGGGAPTVSWVAPYAVAAGGILPIDTLANLNLLAGAPGQHATVYADPTPANNGDYAWNGTAWVRRMAPFAMATGVVQSANAGGSSAPPVYWDGGTLINFPAGRFTVAPVVTVTLQDDPVSGISWVATYSTTATQTVARVLRIGGPPTASYKIGWTAIQMTPTSAAG